MNNKPAKNDIEINESSELGIENRGIKAFPIQDNDTIEDIVNSQEYKDALDYMKGNNNQPRSLDINQLEIVEKGSKPANIVTKPSKTDDIDKPARGYIDKPSKPRSLGINNQAITKPDFLMDHQYQINGTGRQVDMLSHACETMARIKMGQVKAIIDTLPLKEGTDTYALQQQLEQVIEQHLESRVPHSPYFTMYQTLRHRRSWDITPEGGMTVNFDEPLILTDDPLLTITKLPLKELNQDIFIGQPDSILSAHIDKNGTAYVNQCKIDDLTLYSGSYVSFEPNIFQYLIDKGFNTDNWQASPIDRVF